MQTAETLNPAFDRPIASRAGLGHRFVSVNRALGADALFSELRFSCSTVVRQPAVLSVSTSEPITPARWLERRIGRGQTRDELILPGVL